MDETGRYCDEDMVRIEWRTVLREFQPTSHKAVDGKSFYSGRSGESSRLPKLPWSEHELEKLIVATVTDSFKNTKKSFRIN